jgi:hypothetical protein
MDINGNLKVAGDLFVGGDTVTLNTTVLEVEDKNIVLGKTPSTPTDSAADGGGIILQGTTQKTILFDVSNVSWSSNINWNLSTGNSYRINNVSVLTTDTIGAGVLYSSLQTLGALQTLNVDNSTYINNTTISTAASDLILNPANNVALSNKRIVDMADPVDEQDSATKSYTDARVFDRGISMSMDVTGLSNNQISAILDRIAPYYDPITSPEGVARDGTRLRLHATSLSASSGSITYSPTVGVEFQTILVDKAGGSENQAVVSDLAVGQTITGPSVTVSVVRQDKLFVMGGGLSPQSGQWGFESDINAPY